MSHDNSTMRKKSRDTHKLDRWICHAAYWNHAAVKKLCRRELDSMVTINLELHDPYTIAMLIESNPYECNRTRKKLPKNLSNNTLWIEILNLYSAKT